MHPFLAKIIKTFIQSLIAFYSKKMIYFVDDFFTDLLNDNKYRLCPCCGREIRIELVMKNYDGSCPFCGADVSAQALINKKESYERRNRKENRNNS